MPQLIGDWLQVFPGGVRQSLRVLYQALSPEQQDVIDLLLRDTTQHMSANDLKHVLNLVKELANKLYDTNAEIEKLRGELTEKSDQGQPEPDNIFLY